ncbi:MAG TPA: hypothetical protein VIY49_06775 [Bryobacteraceae bacterium]|jgi:hypothetical protein
MSWINAVIAAHSVDEARRVWNACVQREKPALPPLATTPPKPSGWLK